MCLLVSSLTTPVPSALLQSLIQNPQYQHFFIFNHGRPAWFCCLRYAHVWGRETAVSELPPEQPESLPRREVTHLPDTQAVSRSCGKQRLLPRSCSKRGRTLPSRPGPFTSTRSPFFLAKDISCVHNEGAAYSSLLIGDLSSAYSLETMESDLQSFFPTFHLIILQVLICPSWRNPTETELKR